jgi:GNAT superfamily N-acetyltransferase
VKLDPAAGYFIAPLGSQHDRESFTCGVAALDRYLKHQAGQDARKFVAAPFVLIHAESGAIAGFYKLSSAGLRLAELPMNVVCKLPKYPIVPATLLGRLAVDLRHRGNGLGEILLLDALRRSYRQSQEIAALAVVVDARDSQARAFYLKYHFTPFPEQADRLFVTMKTIGTLFGV